ncbi:MAG: RNA polymerase sigma factor [Blastocatellales bacterium]
MKLAAYISDEELLRQMMAGDADAFEQLYDRRQGGIYQFALRMSGSHSLAEDVVQDVFIELMRDGYQFDQSRGTVAGYLFGMARHKLLRRLKRERSFISMTDGEEVEDQSKVEERFLTRADPLSEFVRSETIETVRQAVLSLPEHYREIVVLCSLQEMNYEQAAAIVGCPVGTVRSRLNRARAMLIEKLQVLNGSTAAPTLMAHAGSEV